MTRIGRGVGFGGVCTGLGFGLTLAFAAASHADDPPGGDADMLGFGWRYTRLDLEVTVHQDEKKITVEGKAGLRLKIANSMGPTLAVNSRKAVMQFTRVDTPDGATTEMNVKFPLWPPARMAKVRFDKPFSQGDELELSFAFESTDNASQFYVSPELALASWVEVWYPVPAEMPTHPEAMELALAVGTTRIHMPKSWRSVSDGRLVGRQETDDEATETWELTTPVKRSFAAGPFEAVRQRFGKREVGVYLLSPKPSGAAEQAKALADALAAMEARFGAFPFPGYSIVEVPEDVFSWSAASQQTFILANSSLFQYEGGNLPLFAHEAAHGWWGNLIGAEGPGGILCTESLAQYSAALAIESIEGPEAATEFLRFSRLGYNPRQCARGYFQMCAIGQDMPLSKLGSGGWQHNLSDAKGHWVFHMLRRRIGDTLFFETMRKLIKQYAHKEMSLDEVCAAFEQVAPPGARLEEFLPLQQNSWVQI